MRSILRYNSTIHPPPIGRECRHATCAETCRKKKPKEKKIYTLKRTPIKKNTKYRIPRILLKKKQEHEIYKVLRADFLKDNPKCQFDGCKNKSKDLHHRQLRGNNLNNVDTFMAVCRKHHNWIHEHSKEAREKGYLITR